MNKYVHRHEIERKTHVSAQYGVARASSEPVMNFDQRAIGEVGSFNSDNGLTMRPKASTVPNGNDNLHTRNVASKFAPLRSGFHHNIRLESDLLYFGHIIEIILDILSNVTNVPDLEAESILFLPSNISLNRSIFHNVRFYRICSVY